MPFFDVKFDCNRSLVDQVKQMEESNENRCKRKQDYSSIDRQLNKRLKIINDSQDLTHKQQKKDNIEYSFSYQSTRYSLELMGALIVPYDAFEHVIHSNKQLYKKRLIIEFIYDLENKYYWYARIIHTFSDLICLKFLNADYLDENCIDFNENLIYKSISQSYELIKPLGWCKNFGFTLECPFLCEKVNEIIIKLENNEQMNNSNDKKLRSSLINSIKHLKIGLLLEIQDKYQPNHVWFVEIVKNIGGRLLLRYLNDNSSFFWLFFLDWKLHPLGWGQSYKLTYQAPKGIHFTDEQIEKVLSTDENLADVFKYQLKPTIHRFQIDFQLEILYKNRFYIGTIIELIGDLYFKIQVDSSNPEINRQTKVCSSLCQFIFPRGWCAKHGLTLEAPFNWPLDKKFDWKEYLKEKIPSNDDNTTEAQVTISECSSSGEVSESESETQARQSKNPLNSSMFSILESRQLVKQSEKFKIGSYLECVHPYKKDKICLVRIRNRIKHLLFIKFDDCQNDFVILTTSLDIFPLGWCCMNNFEDFVCPEKFQKETIQEELEFRDLSGIKSLGCFNSMLAFEII